ncbi:MAG: bifunctional 5,10-methylenetetrahydrofolate dehydrogenase/5,10-methenyltetrahydrofolate cyclohydrolase [Patescibacteria group bacterium]
MMQLIDGKKLADVKLAQLKKNIEQTKTVPGLGVIMVGNNPASELYVSLKEKAAKQVGINFFKKALPADISEDQLISIIEQLNQDSSIHGIVVQLPLPEPFNTENIIKAIDLPKDVDGFHSDNLDRYLAGDNEKIPNLLLAIAELIKATDQPLKNKKIALLTRRDIYTRSLDHYFTKQGAKPINIDADNTEVIAQSDIIVTAIGRPNTITGDMIKPGVIIIDVGIKKVDGQTLGDVDYNSVKDKTGWLTPVPGGVGPMTVACLLEKVYRFSNNLSSITAL